MGFFVTFLSLAKFQLGSSKGPLPPPGYTNAPIAKNKKFLKVFREVSGVLQQNFSGEK